MNYNPYFEVLSGTFFHLFLLVLFLVIGNLSRILGAVQKQKPFYLLFVASSLLVGAALVINIWTKTWSLPVLICDSVALGIALPVTLYYWKWLFKELAGK